MWISQQLSMHHISRAEKKVTGWAELLCALLELPSVVTWGCNEAQGIAGLCEHWCCKASWCMACTQGGLEHALHHYKDWEEWELWTSNASHQSWSVNSRTLKPVVQTHTEDGRGYLSLHSLFAKRSLLLKAGLGLCISQKNKLFPSQPPNHSPAALSFPAHCSILQQPCSTLLCFISCCQNPVVLALLPG